MPNLLVVHSTEGTTIAGAVATMQKNRSMSHEVYDPHIDQHAPLVAWDNPARSLRNMRGGVETNNRPGVWQLEVVGKAAQIPSYSDEWHQNLAARIRFICQALDIPIAAPKPFVAYPESYGLRNGLRFTSAEWARAEGIIGHQHVPENTHGDPGDIARTLAYLDIEGGQAMADRLTSPPDQTNPWVEEWQKALLANGAQGLGNSGPNEDGADGIFWEKTYTESSTIIRVLNQQLTQRGELIDQLQTNLTEQADRLRQLETQLDDSLAEPPDIPTDLATKAQLWDQWQALITAATHGS